MVKKLGVLVLDTVFPRLEGDIGRNSSFSFPCELYVVKGATSKAVVLSDTDVVEKFIKGAIILQNKGCSVITTSCGFLIKYQKQISSVLNVPFLSSSLLLYPLLVSIYSEKSIGILTASLDNLKQLKNDTCDISSISRYASGMEDTYFYDVYVRNSITDERELNKVQLFNDLEKQIYQLLQANHSIKAILLECTNMVPFKNQLIQRFKISFYDINKLAEYVLDIV